MSKRFDLQRNPFMPVYANIRPQEDTSTSLSITWLHSKLVEPKPMKIVVRGDATTEEALGFCLWMYWEAGWRPDSKAAFNELDVTNWVLEVGKNSEGVILDRTQKVQEYNEQYGSYVIRKAEAAEAAENKRVDGAIERREALQVSLEIKLNLVDPSMKAPVSVPTNTSATIGEFLDSICQKKRMGNPTAFGVVLAGADMHEDSLAPLDWTVGDLYWANRRQLLLVRRNRLRHGADDTNTNPNWNRSPALQIPSGNDIKTQLYGWWSGLTL